MNIFFTWTQSNDTEYVRLLCEYSIFTWIQHHEVHPIALSSFFCMSTVQRIEYIQLLTWTQSNDTKYVRLLCEYFIFTWIQSNIMRCIRLFCQHFCMSTVQRHREYPVAHVNTVHDKTSIWLLCAHCFFRWTKECSVNIIQWHKVYPIGLWTLCFHVSTIQLSRMYPFVPWTFFFYMNTIQRHTEHTRLLCEHLFFTWMQFSGTEYIWFFMNFSSI